MINLSVIRVCCVGPILDIGWNCIAMYLIVIILAWRGENEIIPLCKESYFYF